MAYSTQSDHILVHTVRLKMFQLLTITDDQNTKSTI